MRHSLFIGVVALTTAALLAGSAAASTTDLEQQLEEARQRRVAIEQRLATSAGDLEGLAEQVEAAEQELSAIDQQDARLREELGEVTSALEERSRQAFMLGDPSAMHVLMSADNFTDVATAVALLESLALRGRGSMEAAEVLRTQLAANRVIRAERRDELSVLESDLRTRVDQMLEDLDQIQRDEERFGARLKELRAEEQRRREAAERRRQEAAERAAQPTAPRRSTPVVSGNLACPVGSPVAFSDTWGAPRSGGRRHQGVDMMARHGTPVYAITAGRLTRLTSSGLGGISIYMFGDDGNEYYYTHLQGYADVRQGQRVTAGQLIAYVGSTGNASASAPHLHFEVHPGGGGAVNPYPYAARACGR